MALLLLVADETKTACKKKNIPPEVILSNQKQNQHYPRTCGLTSQYKFSLSINMNIKHV